MLDKITVDRIRFLHPDLRNEVIKMYNEVNEKILPKDVRLRFSFTYNFGKSLKTEKRELSNEEEKGRAK